MPVSITLSSVGRIASNSAASIVLTLFMLVCTYIAYSMDYGGAVLFFILITLVSLVILYRKISNELIRLRFSSG